MDTTKSSCGTMEGTLPGRCANLAFPYVPMQSQNAKRYNQQDGLSRGTLFPGLDMPFFKETNVPTTCDNPALCELMAMHFAIGELGLYLDTHPDDTDALRLFQEYVSLERDGRSRYEAMYGPLTQAAVTGSDWNWINSPWPWEGGKK